MDVEFFDRLKNTWEKRQLLIKERITTSLDIYVSDISELIIKLYSAYKEISLSEFICSIGLVEHWQYSDILPVNNEDLEVSQDWEDFTYRKLGMDELLMKISDNILVKGEILQKIVANIERDKNVISYLMNFGWFYKEFIIEQKEEWLYLRIEYPF